MIGRIAIATLRAVAGLPAAARTWLAEQLRRPRRRHDTPASDQGA